ncbi:hypothetical protein ACW7GZ_14805 [Luteimonas sp. A537]
MNWKTIILGAAALLVAQTLVGFVEGGFGASSVRSALAQLLLGSLASLLLTTAIFWAMATRTDARPFVHACLALTLVVALSLALASLMSYLFGTKPHLVLVAVEWITLLVALLVGTTLGIRRRGTSADA